MVAGSSLVTGSATARAESSSTLRVLTALNELSRQEVAALGLVLAIVGFSVVAAILLMRARTRGAATEQAYRGELERLRAESDRNHALLLAEPQIIIAWPAGSDRADIAGDVSFLLPPGSPQGRALAFATWLAPEPSLQLDRAVKSLRNDAESFVLHLTTLSGRTVEATGRAIGGQAILRLREISGLRRELAEMTRRYNTLFEETDILRSFATALPWPIWARRRDDFADLRQSRLRRRGRYDLGRRRDQPESRHSRHRRSGGFGARAVGPAKILGARADRGSRRAANF